MAIEWGRIGQPQFDRIVEALVHRLYNSTAQVHAVNGRGGDGGIDIDVRQGERLRIYQLKYFPDGLEGRGRRSGIKRSFKRAIEHSPYEWVLVVPCNLTPGERDFVEGLAGDKEVRITIMDRAALDDRLAAHSDIERSFARTHDDGGLLAYAKIMNRERDVLAGGTADLGARVHDLGRVIDDLDPHWTLDFARHGDVVTQTLRGKHSRAHQVSPIIIHAAGTTDAALADAMERVLGYGINEELILPPEAVEHLTISGPEWIAGEATNVQLAITRAQDPVAWGDGTEAEVSFLSENGTVTASFLGTLTDVGQGSVGRTLALTLDGVVLRLLLRHDRSLSGKLDYSPDLEGMETSAALRAISLRRRLFGAGRFQFKVDEHILCSGTLNEHDHMDELRELAYLRELLLDLEAVQRHCERHFPVPAEIPARERILLRLARRLVDGRCVIHPFAKSLQCTLNGTGAPALRELISTGGRFQVTQPNYVISIGGYTLDLGPVRIFHPRVTVDNSDVALAALDTDNFAGHKLRFRPADSEGYRVILDNALQTIHADEPILPTPLALDGYPEPV
ncbi:hypothetical protein [Streptomyces niveus]|uniref:Restriction endonuclease type IV Mrr domain-containing protein n=1 Tax=Streptomyces niveus TaxID=193462 RepID=A0ABZ2A4T1_STRNV|nr:hypothetical protein [Streptomyces niveus]